MNVQPGCENSGISLVSLGYSEFFAERFAIASGELEGRRVVPARVVADRRGVFELSGCASSTATLSGKLRLTLDVESTPVAGDWVAVEERDGSAVIRAALERKTWLRRKQAGERSTAQVLAANVDVFFVVTACGGDVNPRRLERYLAAVRDGGATPVVVLNKVDLLEGGSLAGVLQDLRAVSGDASVVAVSAREDLGLDALDPWLGRGVTVGFIGSSGVGKSSIVNALLRRESARAGSSESSSLEARAVGGLDTVGRGTHTTTARSLLSLGERGWLMDTPGMRELGSVGDSEGLSSTFGEIESLAAQCRFRDCSHDREPGCAVRQAVEDGALSAERVAGYEKLQREAASAARRRDTVKRAMKERSRQQKEHYKRKYSS